ncbi:MAG: hypothetical protein GXO26_05765 [Crenarchaeota archaeon]|nr:hypothetical protein [Thermoproteota archaeon]
MSAEELARGLSKLSMAALLRFVAAILWLAASSLIISILPYLPRMYVIVYKLQAKMISPSQLPPWFAEVAMKSMIASILMIIGLIILAVSAYAFLWPAFSALNRGSEKFRISNILVKVGLLGYTFTLIGNVILGQYVGIQIANVMRSHLNILAKMLLVKKIVSTYLPIFTTFSGLLTLFAVLVIAGICIGLAVIARITGSKIHYVSLILLALAEIIYIVSGAAYIAAYSSPMSLGMHISMMSIGAGIVSYILFIIAPILIFIGCRADISKVRQLEETELARSTTTSTG